MPDRDAHRAREEPWRRRPRARPLPGARTGPGRRRRRGALGRAAMPPFKLPGPGANRTLVTSSWTARRIRRRGTIDAHAARRRAPRHPRHALPRHPRRGQPYGVGDALIVRDYGVREAILIKGAPAAGCSTSIPARRASFAPRRRAASRRSASSPPAISSPKCPCWITARTPRRSRRWLPRRQCASPARRSSR